MNALATRKQLGSILPADGGDSDNVLSRFANAGIDIDSLAAHLQDEGAKTFVRSWDELMSIIDFTGLLIEEVAS